MIVLVTGATVGLGRASAILLAQRGYRVFAGVRNADRLAAIQQLGQERKLPLESIALDVTDDTSTQRAIEEIERRAGPVNILANNAGIAIGAAAEEISLADYRKIFDTNFFGAIRLAQRVLPEMRRRRQGRIIKMSSVSGKIAVPLMGAYASSKHALEAFSDSLRLELYPFGVYVVLIEPGYIPSSMNQTDAELSSAYAKNAERSPYNAIYQRFLRSWSRTRKGSRYTPEDCARVILRAAEETPPRARYVVTRDARNAILARRFLPESLFDRGVRRKLGLEEVREAFSREASK
jgi:NAD(P)-dependent dehydrogenase (short-subunit alcohol dehydrogenase family)